MDRKKVAALFNSFVIKSCENFLFKEKRNRYTWNYILCYRPEYFSKSEELKHE